MFFSKKIFKAEYSAVCIIGGFVILYMMSFIKTHTPDALSYAYSAQSGFKYISRFFHPHHLMYTPLMFFWLRIWQMFGYDGESIFVGQVLNIILSCCSLYILHKLLCNLVRRSVAALVTILLGISHGYWLYSVEVEVYILSVFFLLLTIYVVVCFPKRSKVLGVFLAFSVLAHQSNVLLFPVVIIALVTARSFPKKEKVRSFFKTLIMFLVIVIIFYLIPIILLYEEFGSVIYWIFSYLYRCMGEF